MSLPVPINWLRTNTRPVERLPNHIWILHERHSDYTQWDDPAGTWWVQPDYYPDTKSGFALAWKKLGELLRDNPDVMEKGDKSEIHLYLTDDHPQTQQGDYWFEFDFNTTSWDAIPSIILGDLEIDPDTPFNEITNEIQVWINESQGMSVQGRLDRANLPLTFRQT